MKTYYDNPEYVIKGHEDDLPEHLEYLEKISGHKPAGMYQKDDTLVIVWHEHGLANIKEGIIPFIDPATTILEWLQTAVAPEEQQKCNDFDVTDLPGFRLTSGEGIWGHAGGNTYGIAEITRAWLWCGK